MRSRVQYTETETAANKARLIAMINIQEGGQRAAPQKPCASLKVGECYRFRVRKVTLTSLGAVSYLSRVWSGSPRHIRHGAFECGVFE
jgi:hypothetical protein